MVGGVKLPGIYGHLLLKYLVPRSVGQATKGKNIRKKWKCDFLDPKFTSNDYLNHKSL